jgi:hypothetical protein
MDPRQTLIDADQAISDGHYQEAIELLEHYAAWRVYGHGYEPAGDWYRAGFSGDAVAGDIQRRIVDAEAIASQIFGA